VLVVTLIIFFIAYDASGVLSVFAAIFPLQLFTFLFLDVILRYIDLFFRVL